MSLKGKIEIAGVTDVGRTREHNEDSIGSEADIGLLVLADGMGGHNAGEVASAIAVNTVLEHIPERLSRLDPGQVDPETGFSAETLLVGEAIKSANRIIHQTAQSQPQCQGMGTTIVVALFYDNRVTIGHVGDSRLYRQRESQLEQITVDHTLLQELVNRGFYTKEQARQSLNRNVITRALGVEPEVAVDLQEEVALPGDIFLLCSDGLSEMIEDGEISSTLKGLDANLQEAAVQLVRRANEQGGRDNISVMLARPLTEFPARPRWYRRVINWIWR